MERKQKVLLTLDKICQKKGYVPSKSLEIGFTAEEVGKEAGISRSNVSGELNKLVREGLVIKFSGRPVRFVTRWFWEKIKDKGVEVPQFNGDDPFKQLVGWDLSLKVPIEQAKAALLYPPHGLHCLIIGPTGTGKTLFARIMFQYAQNVGRVAREAQLVTFNCADYAHNPQLLMSQLFGHIKGAFTGAVQEKPGLVDAAHKSILFLDEIHRLPPEGQEMLFYLIDTGQFRRLGETGNYRHCSTIVIGATTAEPHSSLLATFYRRFPVVINLPSLTERPLLERAILLKRMLGEEAYRIGLPLKITPAAVRAFLLYNCPGNIGQFFNDVRLTCARAFLYCLNKGQQEITITPDILPPHVRPRSHISESYLEELTRLVMEKEWYMEPASEAQDLYTWLDGEMSQLQLDRHEGNERWTKAKEALEKYFYSYIQSISQEELRTAKVRVLRLVRQDIVELAQEALQLVEERLGYQVRPNLFLALALHMHSCLNRLKVGQDIFHPYLDNILHDFPQEAEIAREIVRLMEKKFNVDIPPDEIGFLAMLFRTFGERGQGEEKRVGLVVMAHGNRTATSMAEVANKLVGQPIVVALDVSLETDPHQGLVEATRLVREADQGQGVLLLVDMEPLISWGEIIAKRTGSKVRVLDNVTTAMVIDAARKALLPGLSLDELVQEISNNYFLSTGYWSFAGREPEKKKVIAAICITGEGAARCLKRMVSQWLGKRDDVEIVTANLNSLVPETETRIKALQDKGILVAVIGSIDPELPGIPFISLEELIMGQGRKRLEELLRISTPGEMELQPEELESLLKQYLRFLDASKMLSLCSKVLNSLEAKLGERLLPHQLINLTVHLSCLAERLLAGEQNFFWPGEERIKRSYPREWGAVKEALTLLEGSLDLTVPSAEIAFVVQFLRETPFCSG